METFRRLPIRVTEAYVVIDVRDPDEYLESHIPGAVNIPLERLVNRLKYFSPDAGIITVCGKGGGRSAKAAGLLHDLGFKNATFLCEGTNGWFGK